MKTLYLHIGTPKTGSTAIQAFCANNREGLKRRGYAYPLYSYQYLGASPVHNGRFLTGPIELDTPLSEEERAQRREEGMKKAFRLFRKHNNVILSHENIWSVLREEHQDFLEWLWQACEEKKVKLKIVVYLRRQDAFLESLWKQKVKSGFKSENWDIYIKKAGKKMTLDYERKLSLIADIVGKENMIVRKYEPQSFIGGSLVQDFLTVIGIPDMEGFTVEEEHLNPSVTPDFVEIKRILNFLHEKGKGRMSEASQYFAKTTKYCSELFADTSPKRLMSKEDSAEFMKHFEEGNRAVHFEYFGEETPLFVVGDKEQEKWEYRSRTMFEKSILFFGKVLWDNGVELDRLEEELTEQGERIRELKSVMTPSCSIEK